VTGRIFFEKNFIIKNADELNQLQMRNDVSASGDLDELWVFCFKTKRKRL
jgi:hypothetical protein